MPGFVFNAEKHVDYHRVFAPRHAGPVIGVYRDLPISESVTDHFGRSFTYAGIAPRLRDGRYDPSALEPGQFIVEPGLLYSMIEAKPDSHGPGLMTTLVGLAGAPFARDIEKGRQALDRPSEDQAAPGRSPRNAGLPGDRRMAMREIASTFIACLSLALVLHLLLAALHAG